VIVTLKELSLGKFQQLLQFLLQSWLIFHWAWPTHSFIQCWWYQHYIICMT